MVIIDKHKHSVDNKERSPCNNAHVLTDSTPIKTKGETGTSGQARQLWPRTHGCFRTHFSFFSLFLSIRNIANAFSFSHYALNVSLKCHIEILDEKCKFLV